MYRTLICDNYTLTKKQDGQDRKRQDDQQFPLKVFLQSFRLHVCIKVPRALPWGLFGDILQSEGLQELLL
jgi:hypothetical protein